MGFPSFASGDILTATDMNAVGLWKVTTATATSGGTLNINSCFTSTYARYRIIGTIVGTTATAYEMLFRLRASGTDTATGYYYGVSRVDVAASAINVVVGNNQTYASFGAVANNNGRAHFVADISNPQVAQYTTYSGQGVDIRNASGYAGINVSGQLANTTVYDGITIGYGPFGTGTISNLQVAIYGYRD